MDTKKNKTKAEFAKFQVKMPYPKPKFSDFKTKNDGRVITLHHH